MTLAEAFTALRTRIGWKDDKTLDGFTPSAANQTTDSGLFFQDEHPAINLINIHSSQPNPKISNEDFELYLEDLRDTTVRQVLNDVFERDYLNDSILTVYPNGFDKLITYKMVIKVSQIIVTASRSNRTDRFSQSWIGKLSYDIFREAPNKFAIRGANYREHLGISTKYSFLLRETQRRFGDQKNRLKTITKGNAINELYADQYHRH